MKLKANLIFSVLSNDMTPNKYSKSYLSLKNVMILEEKENFKLTKEIINSFDKISKKYYNFFNNIPLVIIEKYYNNINNNPNSFIFIEYKDNELEMKGVELFEMLEDFYSEMFTLSCLMASHYNLEIKINNHNKDNEYL